MDNLYHELILDAVRNPSHFGPLPEPVATAALTNASCGDDVTVYLKLSPDGQTITALSWEGAGCAISQAAMSVLSEQVQGAPVTHVLALEQTDIEKLLGLEEIALGRTKCLLLGLRAVKQALKSQTHTPT